MIDNTWALYSLNATLIFTILADKMVNNLYLKTGIGYDSCEHFNTVGVRKYEVRVLAMMIRLPLLVDHHKVPLQPTQKVVY